jgi:hypothetical protein
VADIGPRNFYEVYQNMTENSEINAKWVLRLVL